MTTTVCTQEKKRKKVCTQEKTTKVCTQEKIKVCTQEKTIKVCAQKKIITDVRTYKKQQRFVCR